MIVRSFISALIVSQGCFAALPNPEQLEVARTNPGGVRASSFLALAAHRANRPLMAELVRLGVSPDNALVEAIENRRSGAARQFLELGAHPDGKPENPKKPLNRAIFRGALDCVRALVLAGANTEIEDSDGRNALDLAMFWGNNEIEHFLRTVRDRERQGLWAQADLIGIEGAAARLVHHQEPVTVREIIHIISDRFGTDRNDDDWNLHVLSFAYLLKRNSVNFVLRREGYDILTDKYAPQILVGDWSPERISLVRDALAVFANMNLGLVQFEHIVAPFLMNAPLESLIDSNVMSSASLGVREGMDFGIWENQRDELLRVEGIVAKAVIGAIGVERTIGLFSDFYSTRYARMQCLRDLPQDPFPDPDKPSLDLKNFFSAARSAEVDEFMNGEGRIVEEVRTLPEQLKNALLTQN